HAEAPDEDLLVPDEHVVEPACIGLDAGPLVVGQVRERGTRFEHVAVGVDHAHACTSSPPSYAGATCTGIPLRTALPESGSTALRDDNTLLLTPACAAATARSTPSTSCPHPCGRLTTPRITASVTSTGTTTVPTADSTRAGSPCTSSRASVSSGWMCNVQRGLPFTSTSRLCIHELFDRRSRRPTRTSPSGVPCASAARNRATSATIGSGA